MDLRAEPRLGHDEVVDTRRRHARERELAVRADRDRAHDGAVPPGAGLRRRGRVGCSGRVDEPLEHLRLERDLQLGRRPGDVGTRDGAGEGRGDAAEQDAQPHDTLPRGEVDDLGVRVGDGRGVPDLGEAGPEEPDLVASCGEAADGERSLRIGRRRRERGGGVRLVEDFHGDALDRLAVREQPDGPGDAGSPARRVGELRLRDLEGEVAVGGGPGEDAAQPERDDDREDGDRDEEADERERGACEAWLLDEDARRSGDGSLLVGRRVAVEVVDRGRGRGGGAGASGPRSVVDEEPERTDRERTEDRPARGRAQGRREVLTGREPEVVGREGEGDLVLGVDATQPAAQDGVALVLHDHAEVAAAAGGHGGGVEPDLESRLLGDDDDDLLDRHDLLVGGLTDLDGHATCAGRHPDGQGQTDADLGARVGEQPGVGVVDGDPGGVGAEEPQGVPGDHLARVRHGDGDVRR